MFLFNLQLANVLHAISDKDSVYKTSVSNLIKVIDDVNQRMRYVETNLKRRETTSIDSSVIRHLNMSVEELERQNNEISIRLDKANFGLSQLGGQLNLNRNHEVSCNFFNSMIALLNKFSHSFTKNYTYRNVRFLYYRMASTEWDII